jgi:hypothetical protein
MKHKRLWGVLLCLSFLLVLFNTSSFALEEGGYVGAPFWNDANTVWNFLRNFNYEQFYWAYDFMFRNMNNYFVDDMDIAYYCGYGFWTRWVTVFGTWPWWWSPVDYAYFGNSGHRGYGDVDLEFLVMHASYSIPTPWSVWDWYSAWITEPNDIFDGMHQLHGFWTPRYYYTAPRISRNYGWMVSRGFNMWFSWNFSVWRYGARIYWWPWPWSWLIERGAVVMWPPSMWDRYWAMWCPDPPQNHRWLWIWYQ